MTKNPPAPSIHQLIATAKLCVGTIPALLLADDVGVGKTISAGYALSWLQSRTPEAQWILCPPTLMDKWVLELRERFGLRAVALRSDQDIAFAADESQAPGSRHCFVAAYSRLRQLAQLDEARIDTLVFDEIHQLRNRDTLQWRHAHAVARRATTRLGLSATPINNDIQDLASELELLLPTRSSHAWASVIPNLWATSRVHLLGALTTRITKALGGASFAARNIHNTTLTLSPTYLASNEALGLTPQGGYASLARRRMLVSSEEAFAQSIGAQPANPRGTEPKVSQAASILRAHEGQVVICVAFKATATALAQSLSEKTARPIFVLTGDTPLYERTSTLDAFRQQPNGVIVLTQVGSEGLDLQSAACLINYDMHWNPMQLEQRIGRIDRRGQAKATIDIHNLWVDSSVDQRVLSALVRKTSQIEATPFAATLGLTSAIPTGAPLPPTDDDELAEEIALAYQTRDTLERIRTLAFDETDALCALANSESSCEALLERASAAQALSHVTKTLWAQELRKTQDQLMSMLSDLES